MRVFQVFKNEVTVINGEKQYIDTLSNFKLDSGLVLHNVNEIIYDNYQECCVINDEFKNYPNEDFEGYINNIQSYINAKQIREGDEVDDNPGEPSEPVDEMQQQIEELEIKIDEQKDELLTAMLKGEDTASFVSNYSVMLASVPDEVALNVPQYFPAWNGNGKQYKKGDRVEYEDVLYKVLQSHTSQSTWTPTDAPSLFGKVLVSDDGTPQEWQQPDSTNPYMKGDKVIFNGKIYESLIDNNVWSPEVYPNGWKEIIE